MQEFQIEDIVVVSKHIGRITDIRFNLLKVELGFIHWYYPNELTNPTKREKHQFLLKESKNQI